MSFQPTHLNRSASLPDLRRWPADPQDKPGSRSHTDPKTTPPPASPSLGALNELPAGNPGPAQAASFRPVAAAPQPQRAQLFDPLAALLLVTCIDHLLPIVAHLQRRLAADEAVPARTDPRTLYLVRKQELSPYFAIELHYGLCSFAALLGALHDIAIGDTPYVQSDMPLFAQVLELVMTPWTEPAAAAPPHPVIDEPDDDASARTSSASARPAAGPVIVELDGDDDDEEELEARAAADADADADADA